jgi:hypothetical protein
VRGRTIAISVVIAVVGGTVVIRTGTIGNTPRAVVVGVVIVVVVGTWTGIRVREDIFRVHHKVG